ncbi:alpha-amylase family protein [Polaribacter sp. Q13]|uniref:alpha-amylase family protein n=1 Tax=Polaribacter sp. Q13 TaxID=2806551 RepID=UPI00193B2BA2|nr:alpha-amylase family protein [Polaribacter sp. Q13]QVY65631.1 beta-galactosidase [Polaribacter sp. Q13]
MIQKSILVIFLFLGVSLFSQSLEKQIKSKVSVLENLVEKLELKKIDNYKEKLALNTVDIFRKFAKWDENNIDENTKLYKKVAIYKKKAAEMATNLPDFEKKDMLLLLDESIQNANELLTGEIFRKKYIRPNWHKIAIKENTLVNGNRPVFLSDYTWKPGTNQLDKYFGELDVFLISPSQVKNKKGEITPQTIKKIKESYSQKAGFVFVSQKNIPKWTLTEFGEEFGEIQGKPFTKYDIDNPGARILMSNLFKGTVPFLKDKKFTQLGYMLTNEPRWANYTDGKKKVWFRQDVSNYTIKKFEIWLQKRHKTIAQLNSLWKTNLVNFSEIEKLLPVDLSERGTPKWYDWTTFNEERVIDWFQFLKAELLKNDPKAKVHLKIMPSIFTDNNADAGIDLEALTELSDINGNDIAAHYNNIKPKKIHSDWDKKYVFGWRELFMGYDFLKSIKPNQINFNSESHLLSGSHTRDLNMNPKYVRATYWAAHLLGLNASQTWYWPRQNDGSLRRNLTDGYAGSNNQQPRVTFELENTLIDLNTFSEEVTAFQNQRKPIRIFYSKTAAKQKGDYMDGIFDVYERLNFEGISLGFATKNIIKKQDKANWDVILIYNTEHVTETEFEAVQQYLDEGGSVIMDKNSFKSNEYGEPLKSLESKSNNLFILNSLEEMQLKAFSFLRSKKALPEIVVTEKTDSDFKTCTWRSIKTAHGRNLLSIINLGKNKVQLEVSFSNKESKPVCKDLINGIPASSTPVLKPYEVYFVEVSEK